MLTSDDKVLPDNYWKKVVFTFCMGWTVIWVYRSMLSPIYPEIQDTIGTQSNSAMGMIASCYFFGYTAMQIPSGFLVDKFGQKKILIPGFLLFALGVVAIALAKSITGIYVGAVAAGVGCGSYYGAAFSMTAQHVPPRKKGLSTAIVNSGSALGMIIGMNAASLLVKSMQFPWQTMVLISAGLIFLQVLWFAFALRSTDKKGESNPAASAPAGGIRTEESDSDGSIFRPSLLACYLLYFTTCYAYYLIVTWLPNFLATERGIKGGLIGLIVSMIAVTAVPGGLFFAHLSDKKRGKKSRIIIFLEISAFALITVSMFAPNALSLSIILLLYGFLGKMAVDPVLISFVSDKASKSKVATTLGMFNFFGMSSSVVAPALTGYIIDRTGSGVWGFYLGAILLFAGTVMFAFFNRGKKSTAA
ncbi:MAG: MFS transporter [Planctomycetota bacterium]|jgi:MFS family permease|nr:MFS transporter [Planctomycetota bacterium]